MCDTCTWKHRKVNSTKAKTITGAGEETKHTTSFLSSYTVVYLGLPSSLKHNPKVSYLRVSVQWPSPEHCPKPNFLQGSYSHPAFSLPCQPYKLSCLTFARSQYFHLLYSYPTPENLAGFVLGRCQIKATGPVNRTCIKIPVWFISLLSS